MAGLDIFVRVNEELIPVTCDVDDTCGKLAERLGEQIGRAPPALIFQGRKLPPDELLADEGVCPESVVEAELGLVLKHESPFDDNGLIHYIGTLGLTQDYLNVESERRLIRARKEPAWGAEVKNIFEKKGCYCRTDSRVDSFFEIDLRIAKINPTHYSLRHGRHEQSYVAKSWRLEASPDGSDGSWDLLDTRADEETLRDGTQGGDVPYHHGTWEISSDVVKQPYRVFRVYGMGNWGPDTTLQVYLHLSGFEVYGVASLESDWATKTFGNDSAVAWPEGTLKPPNLIPSTRPSYPRMHRRQHPLQAAAQGHSDPHSVVPRKTKKLSRREQQKAKQKQKKKKEEDDDESSGSAEESSGSAEESSGSDSPPANPREAYKDQLATLKEMGADEDVALEFLKNAGGDLQRTIDELFGR
eukprot:Hpha_TRINITY_DN12646_c0_g1::TRINITY_DN12646_c0_g1_i5::g.49664::m.49664